MTQLAYLKEYLNTGTGTEGTLLIPRRIYSVLIDEADKHLIPRSEAAIVFGPDAIPGSSVEVNLTTPDTMDVRLVAEGAEIPLDAVEYTTFNLRPDKYGVAIRITREMLEDSQWNLLEHNVRYAGQRFAENENSLIVSDALDNASNTVTGGATASIANVTRLCQHLEDNDYTPTTIFVGPEVLNDFRNIDTFVEYSKINNTDMLDRGFLGTIYGLKVIRVSKNAGMTTTTAYVTDNRFAFVIAEKRPMTLERFELPTFDMSGAVLTQRLKVRQLRAQAIAKLTTT